MPKKSFLLYLDSLDIFDQLDDVELATLMRTIRHYQTHGELPDMDKMTRVLIAPFLAQFKRDGENYKATCDRNKKNIEKRWGKGDDTDTKDTSRTSGKKSIPPTTKNTDSDSDSDSDSVLKEEEKESACAQDISIPFMNPNRGDHCPTWEEVQFHFQYLNGTVEQAKEFFDYNEKDDWRNRTGHPIATWQSLASMWLTNAAKKAKQDKSAAEAKAAKARPPTPVKTAGITASEILRQRYPHKYK